MGAVPRHGLRVVRSPPTWKVKCAGRTLASKASGILQDVWIETYRLPPTLEREPGRVRGLSGKQTVPPAACDSGSPRSASIGSVLVARYGSPKPGSKAQLLTGPPLTQVWVAGIPAAL